MNPRLIIISGPNEGQTVPLDSERFTIGRQRDNDLQLATREVSRRHCELRRGDDGHYTVVDLDSRHGVFVNQRPVREKRLGHSDMLALGSSALLFLLDDSSASGTRPPVPSASSFMAGSTVAVAPGEIPGFESGGQVSRDLLVLLRLGTALQKPTTLRQLGECLLEHVVEAVPFEHAAVLRCEPGAGEPVPVAVHPRGVETAAGLVPSAVVLDQVARDKVGVLCQRDDADAAAASTPGVGSLLCAPLLAHDGAVLGYVYASGAFDARRLELFGAVAGMASPAFENALHRRWLEAENRRLREHQLCHDLVGESAPMRRLLDLIERVAKVDSTVLIHGESGTGKELTAQAVHRSSPRAEQPFVAVNCATLSENLLESDLFGHEKGAFTGAVARKLGKLEVARGGTLFLDEVGEIPISVQAKLLRVLQEREFERLGGLSPIAADMRVVAATNRDLEAAVRAGTFREDLYYRLKVITLETPPLRQRRDDIPLLTSHFIALHGRRLGRRVMALSPEARRCLMAYAWPGNVRELGNVVERALVFGDADVIRPEDLPDEVLEGAPVSSGQFQESLVEYKKKLVLDAYKKAGRDYGAAAEILGVHVNSLHRMISRLGIKDQLTD